MKTLTIASACIAALLITGQAFAQAPAAAPDAKTFAEKHPRRAEINKRVANQEKRITQERKEGEITAAQAHADRQELKAVKAQEHADVKANGGYITKAEQKSLNKELNGNSAAIGK